MDRAEELLEQDLSEEPQDYNDQQYLKFYAAFIQAETDLEAKVVSQWQTHHITDWRSAAEYLKRRFPDRWGDRKQKEVETEEDEAKAEVQVTVYIPSNGRH
jgi:hypothetical protein